MHVSIKKVSQFFWHASFAVIVCFDLIFDLFNLYYYYFFIADFKFEDDFSNSNSTIWLNRDIPKFKIWHDVNILHFIKFQFKYEHNRRHKNKKLLELKNIWNRNRIYFFHFILLIYNVGQYEHKNTLMFAFYSSYLKDCFFFCSFEKSPWCVPAKYSETSNWEQCPKRTEKYISCIHFTINFWIPAKFLFSHNFHNFCFSANPKNNLLG